MAKPAIKVEGLWKEYTVGAAQQRHATFYDLLSHSLKSPLRRLCNRGGQGEENERFWALRDVNFEIQPGEVVGVIGRNGAGKSTLLKVLSRITAPSRGTVRVAGRMASLLEVGTGFHADLSGRENIYLNGAILGMTRADITRKFDEIVAFADVEKFIDTPVKRYSSGMYVRLAFSVAAHLEPDILVIDEVLAVGDADFQRKCLGKLDDSSRQGRTILVVSHSTPVIAAICRRALWLDGGLVAKLGATHDVISSYLTANRHSSPEWIPKTHVSDDFQYSYVRVLGPQGSTPDTIAASQPFVVEMRYEVRSNALRGRIAIQIRNEHDDAVLSSANTDHRSTMNATIRPGIRVERCEIPGNLLAPGNYFVTISLPTLNGDRVMESICGFQIDLVDSLVCRDGRKGHIAPLLNWTVVE